MDAGRPLLRAAQDAGEIRRDLTYTLSPGPKSLLTRRGAEHHLGGIHAHLAGSEVQPPFTTELVALVQHATTAYLRDALGIDSSGGRMPRWTPPRAHGEQVTPGVPTEASP